VMALESQCTQPLHNVVYPVCDPPSAYLQALMDATQWSEFDNHALKAPAQKRVFVCVCAASARVHTTLLCYYLSSASHTSARSGFNRAEEAQSPSPSGPTGSHERTQSRKSHTFLLGLDVGLLEQSSLLFSNVLPPWAGLGVATAPLPALQERPRFSPPLVRC
jgi:hypothetical protein